MPGNWSLNTKRRGAARLVGGAHRNDPRTRSPWWVEVAVIVWLLWVYDLVNNFSHVRYAAAIAHAKGLLSFEHGTHLAVELSMNRWLGHHHTLALVVSDYYDNAHFVVTLALVALLWWRHPHVYRPLRNALAGVNLIAMAVFWAYPVAPPRMLAKSGFRDTVANTGAFGSWHTGRLAMHANELAAMPSLHMAWAVWCSISIWLMCRRTSVRIAGIAYPVATALSVTATANHFVLDVFGGILAIAVSGCAALAWDRRGCTRRSGPAGRSHRGAADNVVLSATAWP